MVISQLQASGWNVDEKLLAEKLGESEELALLQDRRKLEDWLLNADLKGVACPGVANAFNQTKHELVGPIVLQLSRWRNVSQPLISRHDSSSGVCALALTDGIATVRGVHLEPLPQIDGNTPYGTKVLLSGKIREENGFLVLSKSNTTCLGGHVDELVDKWKVERYGVKQGSGAANAPKWVPFTKAKNLDVQVNKQFAALRMIQDPTEENDPEKDAQFRAQRVAQIEALGLEAASADAPADEPAKQRIDRVAVEELKTSGPTISYGKPDKRGGGGRGGARRGGNPRDAGGAQRQHTADEPRGRGGHQRGRGGRPSDRGGHRGDRQGPGSSRGGHTQEDQRHGAPRRREDDQGQRPDRREFAHDERGRPPSRGLHQGPGRGRGGPPARGRTGPPGFQAHQHQAPARVFGLNDFPAL